MKIQVRDSNFARSGWICKRDAELNCEWDHHSDNPILYTDNFVEAAPEGCSLWLIESPAFLQDKYLNVERLKAKFKAVYTCDETLLDRGRPYCLFPLGTTWIEHQHRGVNTKNELVYLWASGVNHLPGHQLRNQIAKIIPRCGGVDGSGTRLTKKTVTNYMFEVVVENVQQNWYFSEKLIDCLLTRAVPIYCGCPDIGRFFQNIIQFNTLEEFIKIKPSLNEELYLEHAKNIAVNFQRALYYTAPAHRFATLLNVKLGHPSRQD